MWILISIFIYFAIGVILATIVRLFDKTADKMSDKWLIFGWPLILPIFGIFILFDFMLKIPAKVTKKRQ